MSKEKSKNTNLEPDIRKGLDKAKKIKEDNKKLKEDWDFTKREGYNKT